MTEAVPLLADDARRRPSKLWTVCPFILGNEFCERLAFYGLSSNLSIYLMDVMGLSLSDASIQTSLFSGTAYITPLLGAWLADGYWGRFNTILAFSIVYALGMFWMAATALVPGWSPSSGEHPSTLQYLMLYGALYTVALGTGGIKPNVSSFGADQFDDNIRSERKEKQSFFNWFYFSINVGSLIACTVIVSIQEWNWGVGFAIPAVAMALAVVIFIAGSPLYRYTEARGSPLERLMHLIWGAGGEIVARVLPFTRPRQPDVDASAEQLHVSNGALELGDEEAQTPGRTAVAPLDAAGKRLGYSPLQVEEVRMVLRMMPIFLLTILYWTVYTQMASVFVIQAKHMDRRLFQLGPNPYIIPAASMTVFDTIAIIVMIPIYDGIVHPIMKRCRCEFSLLQRIGWGFVLAAAAMVAAAVVERKRMAALAIGENVSVMLQITPYLLVGASEVLGSIGQIEFFYDQAPDVMRSCCTALSLVATALGGYLSAALLVAVNGYTTWLDDLDKDSRLDLYFMLLAACMLLNTLVFVVVAYNYKYKVVEHRGRIPLVGGQQAAPVGGHADAMDIGGVRPGYGYQFQGTPSTAEDGTYSRSVTYMPATPIMPTGLR